LVEPFHNIDKVVTIETSGIAFAVVAAELLGECPRRFCQKEQI
jgi:adenine/guanine phosphoribosyltransferase-like PRPP-binding protein